MANIENGPLEMFGTNGSHKMLMPRAIFPWLVVGGAIYVVDFVSHLLPIAFIRGSRESQRNILSKIKVSSITWFSRHNMKLDFVIFLQFYGWPYFHNLILGGKYVRVVIFA